MIGEILVIEDDELYANLIGALLKFHGWTPIMAHTFGDALKAMETRAIQVVLIDLKLPDSNVITTLDNIEMLKRRGAEKVVVMTGAEVDHRLEELAAKAGVTAVISKAEFRTGAQILAVVGEARDQGRRE